LKDWAKLFTLALMEKYSGLRSPYIKTGGLVYFARMLDKIRAMAKGDLPMEYRANLGRGFDANCCHFLRVNYEKLVERVKQGGSDEEILHWCFDHGRRPSDEDTFVWNEFLRKRGWNDEITEILKRRKKESDMTDRAEIDTMFAYIDADEGRSVTSVQ
jgi:hypothetical protein